MKDVIDCPTCGGNLSRNAYSLSDDYLCDCCGHVLTLDGEHIEPTADDK